MLIIDEAQDLAPDVLEQIRLLTNLETTTQKLLQIILIGQPELIRILEREDLRQLAQRVTARYHLRPFAEPDTRAYIAHRLEVAGAKEKIVSDAATRAVHRASRGIPRLINAICDRALLGAFSQDHRRVTAPTVRRAAGEVLGAAGPRRGRPMEMGGGGGRRGSAPHRRRHADRPGPDRRERWWTLHRVDQARRRPSPAAPPAVAAAGVPERQHELDAAGLEGHRARGGLGKRSRPRPASVTLGDLLADPGVRADKKSAFASLYARWRLEFDGAEDDARL